MAAASPISSISSPPSATTPARSPLRSTRAPPFWTAPLRSPSPWEPPQSKIVVRRLAPLMEPATARSRRDKHAPKNSGDIQEAGHDIDRKSDVQQQYECYRDRTWHAGKRDARAAMRDPTRRK